MEYDAIVCVGPHKVHTARFAICSLQLFARPRRIYVLGSLQSLPELERFSRPGCPVTCLDENSLITGAGLPDLQAYFTRRTGTAWGAGWYLQQFLKIAACRLPDIAPYYLIWDSDTVLLREVEFFDDQGRVLVNPKEEYHLPYFELTKKLLGFERAVPFSFISEHFMVNTAYMRELLDAITSRLPSTKGWVYGLLDCIADTNLRHSGFSEFETYGNFIHLRHPGSYACRSLRSSREGAAWFGMSPNRCDLYCLAKQGLAFVSFERWNRQQGWRLWLPKLRSACVYARDRLATLCGLPCAARPQDFACISAGKLPALKLCNLGPACNAS